MNSWIHRVFKEIVAYDCSWVLQGNYFMTFFHLVDPTEEKRRSGKENVLSVIRGKASDY
jgi:hypothetical protein